MLQPSKQISYRLATAYDIPRLESLVNAHYARKKDRRYFEWQFFNSFYPTICVVAEADGQIMGMFGLQRRALNDGTLAGHLIDLLVGKKWQGRGIFKAMGQIALNYWDDIEVFTVLPNSSGKIASEKAFGLRTIAKIDDWVLRDPPKFKEVTLPRTAIRDFVRYQTSQPYYQWRFESSSVYSYEKIEIAGCGFVYTKKFIDPVSKESFTDIVDYYPKRPDTELLALLWNKIISQLLEKGEKNISTWALPHTPLSNVLKSMGFEILPRERYFCVKTKDPRLKRLLDITDWDLVPADAEIY